MSREDSDAWMRHEIITHPTDYPDHGYGSLRALIERQNVWRFSQKAEK